MMVALVGRRDFILSPCVLPIVPPYLAYMSGITVSDLPTGTSARNRAVIPALAVIG